MFNNKCAEIFCHGYENFSIVCTDCNLKSLTYTEFVLHYQKEHQILNFESIQTPVIKEELQTPEDFQNITEAKFSIPLYEELIETQLSEDAEHNLSVKSETIFEEHEINSNTDTDDDDSDAPLTSFIKNPLESATHVCPTCNKSYKKRTSLKRHIQRHHPGLKLPRKNANIETNCKICNKSYKTPKSLTRHMREVHSSKKANQQCTYCEKVFKTRHKLTCHIRIVHKVTPEGKEPKKYTCSTCNRVFCERYMLKRHEVRHTGVKNYTCDVPGCHNAFYDSKGLGAHKRLVHTERKRYVCDVCGFATKTASSLQTHQRTHTGDRPYKCDQCDKRFITSAAVIEHKVIHNSNYRPHVCDVCGKAFSRPKALYHHKPLHLAEKKFICKICGKAYAQQAGLSAHKRQHNLENFGEPV